ncbi:hypothetical protein PHPALM_30687 [Phytophthora palmivora]|uniref:Uncharacterized protein n=1 Tax=Phytophthora palmivora TaxID=4796 RepID=A0A2P4X4H9_9STRA|nr:hypothetical protein PHPALM_30687 [Phytophthora palmivora]
MGLVGLAMLPWTGMWLGSPGYDYVRLPHIGKEDGIVKDGGAQWRKFSDGDVDEELSDEELSEDDEEDLEEDEESGEDNSRETWTTGQLHQVKVSAITKLRIFVQTGMLLDKNGYDIPDDSIVTKWDISVKWDRH